MRCMKLLRAGSIFLPDLRSPSCRSTTANNSRSLLPSAPSVPTLTESGVPIVTFAWLGICAGEGTPRPIIDLLNSKLAPILKSDEYRALLAASGSVPMSSTPQEMQGVIDDTVKQAAP